MSLVLYLTCSVSRDMSMMNDPRAQAEMLSQLEEQIQQVPQPAALDTKSSPNFHTHPSDFSNTVLTSLPCLQARRAVDLNPRDATSLAKWGEASPSSPPNPLPTQSTRCACDLKPLSAFHPHVSRFLRPFRSSRVLPQCLLELSMLKQGPGDSQEAKQLLLLVSFPPLPL
jgi:hypothetical protein